MIVTGSRDTTARLWVSVPTALLLKKGQGKRGKYTSVCVGICEGHTEAVGAVAIANKTANFVVTGSRDKTLKLWFVFFFQ